MNLLAAESLTKDEAMEFISYGIDRLRDAESKNSWDFFVNDWTFFCYVNDLFNYCFDELDNAEVTEEFYSKINRKQNYPKLQDISDLWNMILDDDNKLKDAEAAYRINYKTTPIHVYITAIVTNYIDNYF